MTYAVDRNTLTKAVTIGVFVGIALLLGFGFRSTLEWRRSSATLTARDTAQAADILVKAIRRDMTGMQFRILANGDWLESLSSQADTSALVAMAFTRYSYPESFFTWSHADPRVRFFNRSGRVPSWMGDYEEHPRFPVYVVTDPPGSDALRRQIDQHGADHSRYVVIEDTLSGEPYQIVARLIYADVTHTQPDIVVGFTVNLQWTRAHYFPDIFPQLVRLANPAQTANATLLDDRNAFVAGDVSDASGLIKPLPLWFVDPDFDRTTFSLASHATPWAIRVSERVNSPLSNVARGANEALIIIASASLALCVALVLFAKATRSEAKLAALRSDFVSSVTHELKMPLANIRMAADRLILQQPGADTTLRYADLIRQQSKRLDRLIDNLLAYSNVADITDAYSFEALSASDLLQGALRDFEWPLSDGHFDVDIGGIQDDVPDVRGDRPALSLALHNLIDNAIRYSSEVKFLSLRTYVDGNMVAMEIADRGAGISPTELRVLRARFVEGRHALAGGRGLGLAIVSRIVADHTGVFSLESEVGKGSTATIRLPVYRA